MSVVYKNNWGNILTALMSKIRAEMKCPVISGFDDENKSNTFIKLILNGSEQGDVTKYSEERTFNIDIHYYIINQKNSQFQDYVLNQASILEALIHETPTLTLSDSTSAYNLMIGDLELDIDPPDDYEDYFIAGWGFSCQYNYLVDRSGG